MKTIIVLISAILTLYITSDLCAEKHGLEEIKIYQHISNESPHDQMRFEWLMERYDFRQIENYISEYYGTYYRYYERYLTIRQKEFAYKLGLSDIFLQPNLRRYENTKLVFTKNVWDDKLTIRYLAPLRDMADFEFYVAFRPSRSVNLVVRSEYDGENSIAAALNKPFGSSPKNQSMLNQTRKFIKKLSELGTR